MTKIKPEHAAIAVVVVAGAYIAGGTLNPIKPSQATNCPQAATKAANYWENDVWKDAKPYGSTTPAPGLTISEREIDAAITQERAQTKWHAALPLGQPAAASDTTTPSSDTLLNGMTEEAYQAKRDQLR
jgi:hypothetical protein